MHEKTLLYSALGVTAIAAAVGVYNAKEGPAPTSITPVSLLESQRSLASAEIPVRLTASDGTGLKLIALKAEAAVEDPLALTELHLTFENPESRVLEGTFRITLPQGASLSRFAMKVGGAWQEGEVVEKQAARQAYEDFLHRKQDPALMEQGAGNEFSARVFPIPARGTKEIIITYAETVETGAPYVLPLRGLPQLGTLDVNVHVAGKEAAEGKTDALYGIHQQRFTPAADFVVDGRKLPRSPGLRAGNLAIARVIPFGSSKPEPIGSAIVMVDTSASRGLGITEQVNVLRSVLSKIPASTPVTVAAFDQDVAPIYTGSAGGFGEKEAAALIARGALGASDFESALAWIASEAPKAKAQRVIWVTDGVATAGETDAVKLKTSKVEPLRATGITRMDAVAIGGIRDDAFLKGVIRGVLDRDGVVLDAKVGPEAIARRLGEATSSGVEVKVAGAKWSWPQHVDGLQAGDEVLVYAELEENNPLKIEIAGQSFAPDLRTVDRPLVERAWAQAKIQSLIEVAGASDAATKAQIVSLSTRHRVLSPYTALLVLETDSDYRRFNIDRNATVDILTVQEGRVALKHNSRDWEDERRAELTKRDAPPPPTTRSRAKGAAAAQSRGGESEPVATATAAAPAPAASAAAAAPPAEPAMDERADTARPPADSDRFGGNLGLTGSGEGGGGSAPGLGGLGAPPAARAAGPSGAHFAEADREESAEAPRAQGHGAPPPPPRPIASPDGRAEPARAAAPAAPATAPSIGSVAVGTLSVDHGIAADEVQRVVRASTPRVRECWNSEIGRDRSTTGGRVSIRFTVDKVGEVRGADVSGFGSSSMRDCLASVAKSLRFPAPGSGDAVFTQTYDFSGGGGGAGPADHAANTPKALPYEGRFKTVMEALQRGDKDGALDEANRWHADQPGDVLSLVALGEAFEARADLKSAARAYGSILELFSFRADSRRFAGERLERLAGARAVTLAMDTYGKAVEQRPDHPASHRLYAYALLKHGEYEKAFEAIKKGATRSYPAGRFRGVDRILNEDVGIIGAVWKAHEPSRAAEISGKIREAHGSDESTPSLRFVLVWETDANDVDFHIHDGKGGHAFYREPKLSSGGELYADVTTGYGPECFTIRGSRDSLAYPFTLQAHYYSRGPMGYGMGKLEVIEHDGKGKVSFDERPFVVMIDRAYVDMGTVDKQTKLVAAK